MSLRYIIEHVDFAVLPVGNLSATLKVSPLPLAARSSNGKAGFIALFPAAIRPNNIPTK